MHRLELPNQRLISRLFGSSDLLTDGDIRLVRGRLADGGSATTSMSQRLGRRRLEAVPTPSGSWREALSLTKDVLRRVLGSRALCAQDTDE